MKKYNVNVAQTVMKMMIL